MYGLRLGGHRDLDRFGFLLYIRVHHLAILPARKLPLFILKAEIFIHHLAGSQNGLDHDALQVVGHT